MIKSWTENKIGEEAQSQLRRGVKKVAEIVRLTLGPKGKFVIFMRRHGAFGLSSDGVTVAKVLEFRNKYEHLGARILQQADIKQDKDAGDGTTTATVLADAILTDVSENQQKSSFDKLDTVKIVRELKEAEEKILAFIDKQKKKISKVEEIHHVAFVSSLSKEVSDMIASMYEILGKEMLVEFDTVSYSNHLKYEIVEGMELDRGWANRGMVTNPHTMEAVIEDCPILVTDYKLDNLDFLKQVADIVSKVQAVKKFVIVAEDFSSEIIMNAISNRMGGWQILLVKAPSIGLPKLWWLEDLAALTGATLISESKGKTLAQARISDLGRVKKVTAGETKTVVIGGGDQKKLKEHIEEVRSQMADEKDKSLHEKRISKLTAGIGRIEVGGHTPQEAEEKRDKIKDAIHSVKSALRDGVVAGGGSTLIAASLALEGKTQGEKILKVALTKPTYYIADNAGFRGEEVVSKCLKTKLGFNAETGKYEDLMKSGIIDASEVVKNAVKKAVTAASLILRSEAAVVLCEEELKETDAGDRAYENTQILQEQVITKEEITL